MSNAFLKVAWFKRASQYNEKNPTCKVMMQLIDGRIRMRLISRCTDLTAYQMYTKASKQVCSFVKKRGLDGE